MYQVAREAVLHIFWLHVWIVIEFFDSLHDAIIIINYDSDTWQQTWSEWGVYRGTYEVDMESTGLMAWWLEVARIFCRHTSQQLPIWLCVRVLAIQSITRFVLDNACTWTSWRCAWPWPCHCSATARSTNHWCWYWHLQRFGGSLIVEILSRPV